MTKEYDVIVIGGGPAGGQCVRELAAKGYKVLLVERYASFEENNFSTAGMSLIPLEEFDIPEKVIGSYWEDITIQCTNKAFKWKGQEKRGVVLDFAGLRKWLAEEAIEDGAEVLMGHRYVSKKVLEDGVIAQFINTTSEETVDIKAKLLVDATGPLRKVMFDAKEEQPEMVCASGIEYIIEVDQAAYDKYREHMVFFLGTKWALKGYSWILPMENKILKVGSGKMHIQLKDEAKTAQTIKKLTHKIIDEYIQPTKWDLHDIHGGTLRYSPNIEDVFYNNKVVAVGDAVSTVNPLGGEGIRYAMLNARLACQYIVDYLETGNNNFEEYRKKWRKENLLKWQVSEAAGRRVYGQYTDEKIEKRLAQFHRNSDIGDLIDIIFSFRFKRLILRILKLKFLKVFGLQKREVVVE